MENNAVNELNAVLKGEYMAVEAYDKFIKAAEDETVKNELKTIQQDHRNHIGQLSQRITSLGGQPQPGTGIAGALSNARLTLETLRTDPAELLKKAYDGEDQGIAAVEEIVKGDLDEESRNLVNGILTKDHEHLVRMAQMLSLHELE